jgi:hypothetical protein
MLVLENLRCAAVDYLGRILGRMGIDQGYRQWLRSTACALLVGFVMALIFMALAALERLVVTV